MNGKPIYPRGFLWGTATSSHQVEGGSTGSNWTAFEDAKDANGRPRIAGGQRSGRACEQWERLQRRYPAHDGYRPERSTASRSKWSKIEPEEGLFNQERLETL